MRSDLPPSSAPRSKLSSGARSAPAAQGKAHLAPADGDIDPRVGVAIGGRALIRTEPRVLETPASALCEAVTPLADHFIRDHFPEPSLGAHHRVSIGGAVARPLELSVAALKQLPQHSVAFTFECAGNNRTAMVPLPSGAPWNDGGVSTAIYRGVRLCDLLTRSGVGPDALEVAVIGADKGSVSGKEGEVPFARAIPLDLALHPDVLLALEMNGEPLPPEHGGPIRLVVPGRYGVDNIKWVDRIQVRTSAFEGHFQKDDYVIRKGDAEEPIGAMRVKSLVSGPRGAGIGSGANLATGWAWSGEGTVEAVEVSIDAGPWQRARLEQGLGPNAWVNWQLDLPALAPGRHVIASRAEDSTGNAQPVRAEWNELGYVNNAIVATTFDVE